MKAQKLIIKYGQNGYETAKQAVLTDVNIVAPVKEVLEYFLEECWVNRQHPALISMCCKAVGGNPHLPDAVSASLVLLTGAADIHDDIIDQSKTKFSILTPLGKFGQDTTLLAGDILLLKALTQLGDACQTLPAETGFKIRRFLEAAFFEIGCAMAKEREHKANFNVNPKVQAEIIEAKGAISQACTQIGAVIGKGTPQQVAALGDFGRTLGVLMALRNEFADIENPDELWNRKLHETLPLPLLYAFEDKTAKQEILSLFNCRKSAVRAQKIAEVARGTRQVQALQADAVERAKKQEAALVQFGKMQAAFKVLLDLAVKNLQT
jgi:geranylgeranyl diphosphate synthase type I